MKTAPVLAAFFRLALTVSAVVTANANAADPQPRPRLHRAGSVAVARVAEASVSTADDAVVLDPLVVNNTKLPSGPRPLREEKRSSFSARKGGPLLVRNTEAFDLSLGLWRTPEMFYEDARFRPAKTRVEFDFVRLKR